MPRRQAPRLEGRHPRPDDRLLARRPRRVARARPATTRTSPHFPLMTPEHPPALPAHRCPSPRPPRRPWPGELMARSGEPSSRPTERVEKLVETRLEEQGTRRTFLKLAGPRRRGARRRRLRVHGADDRGVLPAALQEAHRRRQGAHLPAHRGGDARAHRRRDAHQRSAAHRRRRVRVRAQPLGVQRQPALRRGVRAGEQPARRSGDPLHPRDGDGGGLARLRGLHRRTTAPRRSRPRASSTSRCSATSATTRRA